MRAQVLIWNPSREWSEIGAAAEPAAFNLYVAAHGHVAYARRAVSGPATTPGILIRATKSSGAPS